MTPRRRDSSVGFDQTYVHKLFEPFLPLHLPHDFEGTGIGLAIVKRHGGTVLAKGIPGEGAPFTFSPPGTSSGRCAVKTPGMA